MIEKYIRNAYFIGFATGIIYGIDIAMFYDLYSQTKSGVLRNEVANQKTKEKQKVSFSFT